MVKDDIFILLCKKYPSNIPINKIITIFKII